MTILSSYYFDDQEIARIEEALAPLGWRILYGLEDIDARLRLLDADIAGADILIGGRLTEEQWNRAERLKWIHVPWAGVNVLLSVEGIRRSDILITNSSGVMSDSVADQVMGYVLMLNRDLHRQVGAQGRREWSRYELESTRRQILRGKTIAILGYGAIGRAIAQRACGFGMRVVAMKNDTSSIPQGVDAIFGPDQLHELLAGSDYVVVALPLTDATRGVLGDEEFRRMKPTAFLINIARGQIVRETELIEALRSGTIAGAALDVFEQEPLPADSPLWGLENVIVTPHSAGGYHGFRQSVVDLFLDNLRRYAGGGPMLNVVRKEEGY
jgi:phosphoglycerate dehydrogenase-like enzyme